MTKSVHVDPGKCIGCALCTQLAPKTFEMKDNGKSEALHPHGDDEDKIKQAIEQCPVDAISLK